MSDIRRRITTELREHQKALWHDGSLSCDCDGHNARYSTASYDRHIEDAVVDALGLKRETRYREDGYAGQTIHRDGTVAVESRPCTWEFRWVTAWEPEQ